MRICVALTRGTMRRADTWQGELLDQIEYTVAQSVNYTGKAVEELRTAQNYQKKVPAPPSTTAPNYQNYQKTATPNPS